MKIFQFIPQNEKENFFNDILNIYSKKDEYKLFLKYFKKNWCKCNFLNFEILDNELIKERTDNYSEIFNKNLNKLIGKPHPKISI